MSSSDAETDVKLDNISIAAVIAADSRGYRVLRSDGHCNNSMIYCYMISRLCGILGSRFVHECLEGLNGTMIWLIDNRPYIYLRPMYV